VVRNAMNVWGWPARLFHWLAAAAILVLLGHGWWMTHVTPRPDRIANYSWHAALGYDLLALMVLRLLWRWSGGVPALPADAKPWERIAASCGHVLLYLLTFATTLAGWALAGTMQTPLTHDLFGVPFPLLYVNQDHAIHEFLEDSHKVLAYLLAAIVAIHVAGALRHHLLKRNDVLRRMLWSVSKAA
jgi:cytochrome b561